MYLNYWILIKVHNKLLYNTFLAKPLQINSTCACVLNNVMLLIFHTVMYVFMYLLHDCLLQSCNKYMWNNNNEEVHITIYYLTGIKHYVRYIITSPMTDRVTNSPPMRMYLSCAALLSMSDIVALDSPSVFARSIIFLCAPFSVSL